MNRKILKVALSVFVVAFLFVPPAQANAIIPFFAYTWMGMVFALVPIVVIDTLNFGFLAALVLTAVGGTGFPARGEPPAQPPAQAISQAGEQSDPQAVRGWFSFTSEPTR